MSMRSTTANQLKVNDRIFWLNAFDNIATVAQIDRDGRTCCVLLDYIGRDNGTAECDWATFTSHQTVTGWSRPTPS